MLTQASRLSILFIMLMGFAQVSPQDIPKGIYMQNEKRQIGTGGGSPSSTPEPDSSTPDNGPSSTPNNNPPSSSEDNNPPSSTDDNNPPSSTDDPGSTPVTRTTSTPTTVQVTTTNDNGDTVTTSISTDAVARTTETRQNSFVTGEQTTLNAATLTQKTVISTPLVTSKTIQSRTTSFFTGPNGVVHSTVYESGDVVARTTGFAQTTINPSLAGGGGSGSGISASTKAVIGGVVGGIGGAVIIGGLAFVLWRVYGKKKQQGYQEDYGDKYSNRESSMTYGSEGYSSYGGRVNTASNF